MKYTAILLTIIIMFAIVKPMPSFSVEVEDVASNLELTQTNLETPTTRNATEEAKPVIANTPDYYRELICKVFGSKCDEAIAIAECESVHFTDFIGDEHLTFEENGVTYGQSYGPFQIRHLRGRPDPDSLLDPIFNIQFAKNMYDAQGWGPWTCKYRLAQNL